MSCALPLTFSAEFVDGGGGCRWGGAGSSSSRCSGAGRQYGDRSRGWGLGSVRLWCKWRRRQEAHPRVWLPPCLPLSAVRGLLIVAADRAVSCVLQMGELVLEGHHPPPNEHFGDLVHDLSVVCSSLRGSYARKGHVGVAAAAAAQGDAWGCGSSRRCGQGGRCSGAALMYVHARGLGLAQLLWP